MKTWLYLYSQNYTAGILGHYHKSSNCFEYQENPYLNQATPKSTNCQIWAIPLGIFLPKKIVESKTSNPKYFNHPYYLKSTVLPLGC